MTTTRTIQQIDPNDVHRITSGQVIVSLANAVKELVENALDAGARRVEVRLAEHGLEAFEVTDDGRGIDAEDRPKLALKHWTSKLKNFEDLTSVASFGFRGEALSSLCEVAGSLSVVTRTAADETAYKMEYDRKGAMVSCVPFPTGRTTPGTTVSVTRLFQYLPVRRVDFEKNIKKHYNDVLFTLQGYALICEGVKIACTNVLAETTAGAGAGGASEKTKKTVVIQTQGGDLESNVACVFGSKFLGELMPFEAKLIISPSAMGGVEKRGTTSETREEKGRGGTASAVKAFSFNDDDDDDDDVIDVDGDDEGVNLERPTMGDVADASSNSQSSSQPQSQSESLASSSGSSSSSSSSSSRNGSPLAVRVYGLISRAKAGVGRTGNDRQFWFLNGRPVDLRRFTKAANEVWRQFEMRHKPAFVLNVELPDGAFDVNLAPNKREVMLDREAAIAIKLKECLDAAWAPSRYTFNIAQGGNGTTTTAAASQQAPTRTIDEMFFQKTTRSGGGEAKRVRIGSIDEVTVIPSSTFGSTSSSAVAVSSSTTTEIDDSSSSQGDPFQGGAVEVEEPYTRNKKTSRGEKEKKTTTKPVPKPNLDAFRATVSDADEDDVESKEKETLEKKNPQPSVPTASPHVTRVAPVVANDETSPPPSEAEPTTSSSPPSTTTPAIPTGKLTITSSVEELLEAEAALRRRLASSLEAVSAKDGSTQSSGAHSSSSSSQEHEKEEDKRDNVDNTTPLYKSASIGSSQAEDVEAANAELELVFRKEDFLAGEVVGQFNLGFIVLKVRGELFIVDQHASDEKFRYETLRRETTIHRQRLLQPLAVELTATEAETVRDHLDVFEANGFSIRFEDGASSSSEEGGGETESAPRALITHMPYTKQTTFGPEDVRELAALLRESPPPERSEREKPGYVHPKLPKMNAMYASRACRSAVMIGDPLGPSKMARIVASLAGLENPWCCPHSRPTMRYLTSLKEIAFDNHPWYFGGDGEPAAGRT